VNGFTLPVLGMAHIATCAGDSGYNVGVLDAEACGLGIAETARLVNGAAPRWAGHENGPSDSRVRRPVHRETVPRIKQLSGLMRHLLQRVQRPDGTLLSSCGAEPSSARLGYDAKTFWQLREVENNVLSALYDQGN
jgi:hypothetical protein